MPGLSQSLYRSLRRYAVEFESDLHKKAIVETRFSEFLPVAFRSSAKDEIKLPELLRQAFLLPAAPDELPSRVHSAFSCLKQLVQDRAEIEVLSTWHRHDPNSCSETVGAALISHAFLTAQQVPHDPAAIIEQCSTVVREVVRALGVTPGDIKEGNMEDVLQEMHEVIAKRFRYRVERGTIVETHFLENLPQLRVCNTFVMCVLYAAVARELGFTMRNLRHTKAPLLRVVQSEQNLLGGAPGNDPKPLFVDVLDGGRTLELPDVQEIVADARGKKKPLEIAPSKDLFARILLSLLIGLGSTGNKSANEKAVRLCKAQLMFLVQH